jgi:hypothetical protein
MGSDHLRLSVSAILYAQNLAGGSAMSKTILCLFGVDVDVDAVAGWLGSYGGEDSSLDISRGLFAGEIGLPRPLKLFGMKVPWVLGRAGPAPAPQSKPLKSCRNPPRWLSA